MPKNVPMLGCVIPVWGSAVESKSQPNRSCLTPNIVQIYVINLEH